MAHRELELLVRPTMKFGLKDMYPLQARHIDTLVIQLQIATAMVRRILVELEVLLTLSLLNILRICNTMKKIWKLSILLLWDSEDKPCTPSELKDYPSEWTTRTPHEL